MHRRSTAPRDPRSRRDTRRRFTGGVLKCRFHLHGVGDRILASHGDETAGSVENDRACRDAKASTRNGPSLRRPVASSPVARRHSRRDDDATTGAVATDKRRDEEEASTSGRDAREIVNDLVPLERSPRVIRGRARGWERDVRVGDFAGGSRRQARCPAPTPPRKGGCDDGRRRETRWSRRELPERTCRAREAAVTFEHLCGTFDGDLPRGLELAAGRRRWWCSAATDPRAA